ncbi:histone deacetylase 6-like [Phasianus colchicus]|uniref:histone deacetylase 6-like n=1 Tax=Phasianus colchicus TaxID=9054 RepID=UPI00129EF3F3|nr:histone deacetylase 6-like [Phasianus colchicus]
MEAHSKYWSGLRGEPEVEDEPEEEEEGEEARKDEELGGDDEEAEPPMDPPQVLDGPRPRPTARTALVFDERMEEHYNPWDSQHPECPQRLSRALQRLWDLGLTQRCLLLPPQPARPPQLRACHT